MTTNELPEPKADTEAIPAPHSSAEQAIKKASIDSESQGGRKMKFIPEGRSSKVAFAAAGFVGIIVILLIVVMLAGGGYGNKQTAEQSAPVEIKDLDPDNNSKGYVQSGPANFGSYSLDLSFGQPAIIKSSFSEAKLGEQISWQDGFAILAASVDRDYRPASEFDYKKIAEAGDELVRVNFLVGNASSVNIPIGYRDLALYAEGANISKTESARVSEDTYSPKDGQILGAKQTQKISLHFRVKRDQQFYITKSKTIDQKQAKVKNGEEKKPVLSLKINL